MNKKHFLWILIFYPVFAFGQVVDEVNMNLGFNVNTYDIEHKTGFSSTTNSEEISLFIDINGRKYANKRISFNIGVGVNREYLGFNPLINVGEVNSHELSNFDTLTIAKVGNWDWQFRFPIGVSFDLFDQIDILPPLIIIPRMRLTAGLTNKITFNRINTDNIIISEYNEANGLGYEYYDENLNNYISDYYSEQIKYYKLMMNLGIEFFYITNSIGTLGGIKYSRHLISPVNSDIKNMFSMIGYIGIYYKINNR